MDVKSLTPPATAVAGRIGGQEFRPDKIEFDGSILTFRQGKEFFADREIKLMMFGGDTVEGLKLDVAPGARFSNGVPHIHASWKKNGGDQLPETEMHLDKYALKLELGKVAAGKLVGKIYLCLPDAEKSYLAGTFSVNAEALGTSKIHGTITLKGQPQQPYALAAGYLGRDTSGKNHSGYTGFTVASGTGGFTESFATRLTVGEKEGCSFRHGRVPPGTYLVYVVWDKHYFDWRWVDVKDHDDVTVDLTIDPRSKGDLEVTLASGAGERKVNLVPLDAQGKLPAQVGSAEQAAADIGNAIEGLRAKVLAEKDEVTFTGLNAGHYRVVSGKLTADIEVKAKSVAKVNLPAAGK